MGCQRVTISRITGSPVKHITSSLTVFTAIIIPPRVILALKVELLDFTIAIFPIHGVLEMNPPCTKNANSSKWVAIEALNFVGFPYKKIVSVIISQRFLPRNLEQGLCQAARRGPQFTSQGPPRHWDCHFAFRPWFEGHFP